MNKRVPDEFSAQWSAAERQALTSAWAALEEGLPEPPTGRMRRRLRRMIWQERLQAWGGRLSLAGMALSLALGLLIGRALWTQAPVEAAPDYRLEAKILAGNMTAARLDAIVKLRRASELPEHAANSLAGVVRSPDASTGVRLAALDALLAHATQPAIRAQLIDLLDQHPDNPMLEARLREAQTPADGTQL